MWGVGLMISGAFVAFAVIRYGADRFRNEAIDGVGLDWRAGRKWAWIIRYAVPLQATVLLVWWLYQSAAVYAPDTWYNPFEPYSVMTCLVQWGVALSAFVLLNGWIVRKTRRPQRPAGAS